MTDVDLRHDDLHRENVNLHRKIVALTERAVNDHAAHGRDLVRLGLTASMFGMYAGVVLGDAWGYALCVLGAAHLGLTWRWRNKP